MVEYADAGRRIAITALPFFKKYKKENYIEMFPDCYKNDNQVVSRMFNDIIYSLDEYASGRFDEDTSENLEYSDRVLKGLQTFTNFMTPEIAKKITPIVEKYIKNHSGIPENIDEETYTSIFNTIIPALSRYGDGCKKDDSIRVGMCLLGVVITCMWD